MSPENQAENTSPSTEKTAKSHSAQTFQTQIQRDSNPSRGERIHPKKAEGRFAKLRIAAVFGDPVCILCYSMVQLERPSGGFIQYP